MNRYTFLFLLSSIFILAACGSDTQETAAEGITEDKLLGYWEIQQASRNGEPTESLDDLYLEFIKGGRMRTNMAGKPDEGTFELNGNTIEQRGTEVEADYTIESLSEDELVLTTTLRNYDFRFVLARQVMEE